MRIVGKSASRPNIVYVYDTAPEWQYHAGYIIAQEFREYDTMGDGMTAHTPTYCTAAHNFADFMASMRAPLRDAIMAGTLDGFYWGWRVSDDAVAPWLALRYNPDKRQWYSYEHGTLKTSGAASKEHDKRWHRVDECADGTAGGAMVLYERANGNLYGLIAKAQWLTAAQRVGGFGAPVAELLGLDVDPYEFSKALTTCCTLNDLAFALNRTRNW